MLNFSYFKFSIEGEIAKMKKENEKKGLKKTNQEHLEDLPGHLNTNAPVFDRIRDRVAQEKADARKQNAFASATETETELEFEDVPPVRIFIFYQYKFYQE